MEGSENLKSAENLLIIAYMRAESFENLMTRFKHPENIAMIEKELNHANEQLVHYRKLYLQTLFAEYGAYIDCNGKVVFKD